MSDRGAAESMDAEAQDVDDPDVDDPDAGGPGVGGPGVDDAESRQATIGLLYSTGAFLLWGLSPVFWKWLGHVSATELVAHRIVWCAVLMVPVLAWQGRLTAVREVLRTRRTLVALVGTTVLIGSNWLTYIWAMGHARVLQASLGYFINPLVNVLLGMLFLRERLRAAQWVSVALAAAGVAVLTFRVGQLPWLSLTLAFTFGFYGLIRKRIAASPEEGLAIETWLLSPWMIAYLATVGFGGGGAFGRADATTHVLLVATGLITALPLAWFTHGARRLDYTTVGILQYIAPTCQFLLAVLVFHEPFERPQLLAFVLIWTAIAVFTADLRREWSGRRRLRRPRSSRAR